ncbi:MAG: DUF2752 domain-containing protein [Pirellulales bacterium]
MSVLPDTVFTNREQPAWTDRPESPFEVSAQPARAWRGLVALDLVILLAATAVVALAALLQIHQEREVWLFDFQLPETCSWRRIYHVDCMGCGLTRSFISLAHFSPLQAWRYNPAGLVLFAGVLYQFPFRAAQLWRFRRGLPALSPPLPLYLGWVVLAIVTLLTQWTIRTGWDLIMS